MSAERWLKAPVAWMLDPVLGASVAGAVLGVFLKLTPVYRD